MQQIARLLPPDYQGVYGENNIDQFITETAQ